MRSFVLAVALFAWLIPIPAPKEHGEQAPYSNSTESSKQSKANPTPKVPVTFQNPYNCQTCEQNTDAKKDKSTDPLQKWLERVNAGSTVVIAIFAVVTGIAVVFQVITVRNSERAWLIVVDVEMPHEMKELKQGRLDHGFGFHWAVKNSGKTPAFITKIGARFHGVRDLAELPDQPNIETAIIRQPTDHYPGGLSVGPGDTIQRYTLAEREGYVAGPKDIWISYGVVEYKTVFWHWRTRKTYFCYIFHPEPPISMLRSPNPPGYTRQT